MSDEEYRDEPLVTAEEAVEEATETEHAEQHERTESHDESSEVATRAKKYGHLSKEDWEAQGKDPDQWKSPEEFDKTGKILEQLYSMRKKLDTRDREIQSLVDYQQRTSQREYDRAKQDLEQRLALAKDDMDMEAVSHYTKEITRVEDVEKQKQQQEFYQRQQEDLTAFQERNKHWYNPQNQDIVQRAHQIDEEFKQLFPNITNGELLQKIEQRIQYEYPDRVAGKAAPRANISSATSSVNKTSADASGNKSFRNLSQELKDTYHATKRIIEARGDKEYTVGDFIKRLKQDGEI